MENIIMLQTMVGALGVMAITVSAIFAGYWNFFGKKQFPQFNQQDHQKMNQDTPYTTNRSQH